MTIGNTPSRVLFTCDGMSTVFPVQIQAYQATDLTVILTAPLSLGGAESTLVLNSTYTLAATGSLAPPQWTLTTVVNGVPTPYAAGYQLQVFSNPLQQQQTQFVQGQAFPSLAVQTVVDRLTQMIQRQQDQENRSIRAPDGDVSPNMLLPPALQRAGLSMQFDANGNLVLVAGLPPGTTLSTATLAPFLGLSQTQAEASAGVTPVNLIPLPGDIRRYGGSTANADNTAALAAAVAQAGQSLPDAAPVSIPAGNFNFVSVANGSVCTLLSNVTIRGAAKNQTTLTVTGTSTTNGFFVGTNVSNVRISELTIVGNSNATSSTNGCAVYVGISSAAVANCTGVTIERCAFSNFQANYWITLFPNGSAVQNFGMGNIRIRDCDFTSLTGNMQNPSNIAFPSHCIAIMGGSAPNATMYDVEVTGCNAQCQFIKGFFINWGGSSHVRVHHNVVKSSGLNASDNAGSYAIYAYQQNHVAITGISNAASAVVTAPGHNFSNGDYVTSSQIYDSGFGSAGTPGTLMAALNDTTVGPISGVVGGTSFVVPVNTSALASYSSGGSCSNVSEPDLIDYSHNIIDYVRDNGFYLASCNRVSCVGNTITLQQSSNETSLVKGAVGADGCRELMVANNTIAQCQGGIHVTLRMIIGRAMIVGNSIKNMASNALLIKAFVSPNSVQFTMGDTLLIEGNQLESLNGGEQGIQLLASNLFGIRSVDIIGNHIDCFSNGLLLNANSTADMLIKSLNVKSNTFIAENAAVCQLATTLTPYIDLNGNTFKTGTSFNGSVDHVTSNTSNGVSVRNNIFEDWPSGASSWLRVISPGAGSQCQGNRFINVPTANMVSTADTNDLGRTTPTWTGKQSDWVDNILSIEAGASSSKYVQFAWWYDATAAAWKQLRGLTGN